MNEIPTSEMERQLRILMNVASGEPPRPVSVGAVRRRVIRRRLAECAAAATALALIAGVSAAFASQPAGTTPAASRSAANPPRYYLQQAAPQVSGAVVRSTATGRITGTVRCPRPAVGAVLMSVAPASNGIFFIVCEKALRHHSTTVFTDARIYRFRLTNAGRVSHGYFLVRGGDLAGLTAGGFAVTPGGIAVTPDGSELAVIAYPATASAVSEVIMINTRTGAHAYWHGMARVPGKVWYGFGSLSLTADGRELVFLAQPRCIKGAGAPACHAAGGEEIRALSPAGRGGQIGSSRLLMKQAWIMRLDVGYINGAVISPDGSMIRLAVVSGSTARKASSSVSVQQVPAATGRHPSVLYRMLTGNGFSYRLFSADPSGKYLIFDAGPSRRSVNGWIDHGRLVPLTPRAGNDISFEAW